MTAAPDARHCDRASRLGQCAQTAGDAAGKGSMMRKIVATALAALAACGAAAGAAPEAALRSHDDGKGTTTYWGEGASFEIVGPGVTVFFLRRDDGRLVAPMVRVAYVGDRWINVRGVSFTVGERIYGPYADVYGKPSRMEAGAALVVETLLFNVDSDEKWQMLDGIAQAAALGRPVIAVFDADAPYGIELDPAAKRATERLVRGFRDASARSP
jgi:hypothetical protein